MDKTLPIFSIFIASSAQIIGFQNQKRSFAFPCIVSFSPEIFIKILIKGADWAAVRAILRRKYRNNDLDQLMNSREFFEVLKKKFRSEDDDLLHYCQLFASISRDLVLRKRLDLYTQCQWFLQGLLERVVMEIFYQYDIDLEDDDGLDFGDLLEKTLVLVKRRKFLADFVQDKETDRVSKYADPQEKVPTTPNNVEPFTYPAQDLTPPTKFYTVQGTVQEDTPVVRIHASQIGEVSTGEVSSGADDCMLISDSAEDFYKDLGTLFTDLKPGDEKVGELHVDFVTVAEPLDDTIGFGRYAHSPDSSSKRTRWKSLNLLDAGIGVRKKASMISEGPAGFDGMIAGRWVRKSEDHG